MTPFKSRPPGFALENALWGKGTTYVAGVDEVGRGPIAGPVVAGAVIFPQDIDESSLIGIRDSKELRASARERMDLRIHEVALAVGIGRASVREVDALGIVGATRRAMSRAIGKLSPQPQALLIDALSLPGIDLPQQCPIKGDRVSLSIAAASIVAKVARDRMMVEADRRYPGYGFSRNKGYGTREHMGALELQGPCIIHRVSFAPVARVNGRRMLV